MAKFSIDRFPAGFFDLTQDIAGELPLELIEQWTRGDRSEQTALRLLSPYAEFGTMVATDAAGLTSLSRAYNLAETLELIHHPKEIVRACGAAIGGEPVGSWAADNTQMFYPAPTPPGTVLGALLTAMDRIGRECAVKFGAAVHSGCFFHVSGGLYGAETDRVEQLAEDRTAGGEILLTPDFVQALGPKHPFTLEERADLPGVRRVLDGPRSGSDGARIEAQRLPQGVARRGAVVLAERERESESTSEVAVLNGLALSAAMRRIGSSLLQEMGGREVKIAGRIGVFLFDEAKAAYTFARLLREVFAAQNVDLRIGIDEGDLLLFDFTGGRTDIAGMPVNLASKLAQDHGEFGRIYLTQAAAASAGDPELERKVFKIAGVNVGAWVD